MDKIKLNVLGLSYSQTQSGAYALILTEENTKRRIPIIIGGFEAQAIAIELEGLKPPRPLTHDLFVNMANTFDINLLEVNINKLDEGIFYSDLICTHNGQQISIDARTSDAIALALRFRCPIFTTSEILTKAGIEIDIVKETEEETETKTTKSTTKKSKTEGTHKGMSVEELQELLQKSIQEEDYEQASKIRDEINKRKDKEGQQ